MEPRILVVDDELAVLELVRDVLQEEGVSVEAVPRPDKIGDLNHPVPDLLLLDLMLPGKNGIDLARELQQSGLEQVPMVAMSASDAMLRRAVSSHLFQEVLPKPFDIAELLDTVDRYVSTDRVVA